MSPFAKFTKVAAIAALLLFATFGQTTVANAVTNPADNPNPITVTGDDGNTYVDGQDTLPGFDDEQCTYIPGAYFDFANNRVHYADGKSIAWTEWDRATGYQDWLASQSVKPSPTPSASASNSSATGTKPKSTKPTAKAAPTASAAAVASANPEATTSTEIEQAAGEEFGTTVIYQTGLTENPGRKTGLAILGSLFAAGIALLAGNGFRQRFRKDSR